MATRFRTPKPGSEYYLPPHKFKMVVNFCLSYREMKAEIATIALLRGSRPDATPRASDISDPTYHAARARAKLQEKIDLIENTVLECAGEDLFPYMLRAVTDDQCTLARLMADGADLTERQYTSGRRMIYHAISKRI